MTTRQHPRLDTVEGEFQYPIYSPKGGIEGALLKVGDAAVQLVFDPHDEAAGARFAALAPGQSVAAAVRPEPPSDKGEAAHPVHRFERLVAIDGAKPERAGTAPAGFSGTVVRLNFARHGEANGVVLDTGDFIHTRPDGMARLKLAVGDPVQADGPSRALFGGGGQVVEATHVNGNAMQKKPRPGG